MSLDSCGIENIPDFSRTPNIQELYLCNNKLKKLSDTKKLSLLVSMLILDVSRNPMCDLEHYRRTLVYSCPNAKVIDGTPVDNTEFKNASTYFLSRVRVEDLMECIGYHGTPSPCDLIEAMNKVVTLDISAPEVMYPRVDSQPPEYLCFNDEVTTQDGDVIPGHSLYKNLKTLNINYRNLTCNVLKSFGGLVNLVELNVCVIDVVMMYSYHTTR